MSFPSSFRSVCERGTDLCISVGWLSLYLYKAMTLQGGFNRSKCIKDDEIPCEKEVHLSILVKKSTLKKYTLKECNVLRHLTACYLHSENSAL